MTQIPVLDLRVSACICGAVTVRVAVLQRARQTGQPILPVTLLIYNFHARANALKLRSYVRSASGGKQQPGNCFMARWYWRQSQQIPFLPQPG